MTPIELAQAINAMEEDDLIRFNKVYRGYGCNAELMQEKISDMSNYVTVDPIIFGEATARTSLIDEDSFHYMFTELKRMYHDGTSPKASLLSLFSEDKTTEEKKRSMKIHGQNMMRDY